MLEFYDFIIYGIFSIYFAHQFFHSNNELIVIIKTYLLFLLGYVARPVGGIIFSHIGDEYGRKKVLIITILLMGAASLGIGILPTYTQIGTTAPILLLILRLIQGLALGGELPSTYVYISEGVSKHRGLAFGITMAGVNSGLLLGMLINSVLTYFLTQEQLISFGWRIPFIIGGIVCMISYQIRKTLHETAAFQRVHDKPKLPLIYLFHFHFKECLAGTALVAVMASLVVVGIIFMPTYLHDILNFDNQRISHAMTILMVINVITIYLTGLFAQKYGPFAIMKGLLGLCCFLIPLSYFLIYHQHMMAGILILGCLEGIAAMITPYAITTLFEPKIRLTGVALCYNIAFTVFGALSPVLITNLIREVNHPHLTPCIYLLIMVFLCYLGLSYVGGKK